MPVSMERAPLHLTRQDRVLLIRLGAVGDVLRTLPALHLIRRAYPETRLAWIVEDLSRELLAGHPEIDEVIRFPVRELRASAASPLRFAALIRALARELRRRSFTVTVDFQGSIKSGLLARLSGAPRRVGFAAGHCREMSFLLSNVRVRPRHRRLNRVEKNLILADALGADGDEVTVVLPETPGEGEGAAAVLREAAPGGEPIVLLAPGTSIRQSYKRWPPEAYAKLATMIRDVLGAVPLLVWGPGEEELAGSIVAGSAGRARLAPPTGLRQLAAILRRAALFIGADTGPMHLAWAVGCPLVALFGPTDPRLNAPLGPGHVVLRSPSSMETITPDEVLAAARPSLARPLPPRAAGAAPRWSRAALFREATDSPT